MLVFSHQRGPGDALNRLTAISIFAAACALFAPDAHAVTPARLIGPDLVAQPVTIAGLHDETLNYFDEQRILRSAAVDGFVQIRAIGDAEDTAAPYPCVTLADGQRFTGEWVGPTPDGGGLRWRHDLIGGIVVPLDELASVTWRASGSLPVPTETPAADTLTFVNGDTLVGFVSALNGQGVVMVPDAGGATVTIPYERIASLAFANPARPRPEPYHLVTLADGTRAWVDQMRLTNDTASWLAAPPGVSPVRVQMPIAELTRIDFRSGGMRLIDLTELPMHIGTDPGVFGLSMPARVSGRSIRAHAPATLTFELPEGAVRFAAVAELDTADAPGNTTDWSDFHVVVLTDATEVGRWHIKGTEPQARINAGITGQELTIRLDPGVNGPILDRLWMSDAVVLVRVQAVEPSGATGR